MDASSSTSAARSCSPSHRTRATRSPASMAPLCFRDPFPGAVCVPRADDLTLITRTLDVAGRVPRRRPGRSPAWQPP